MKPLLRRALFAVPLVAVATLAGLLLALVVGVWVWGHSAGSFEQALRWAQAASERQPGALGRLQVEFDDAAAHRLTEGGPVRRLRWSRDGLAVQADTLELRWPGLLSALLGGRGVVVQRLAAAQVTIDDQRPPRPDSPPPTELPLPLPVDLAFDIGSLELRGTVTARVDELRGRYRFQDSRHALQVDTLRWADGRYQGQATLDASAPLQLDLQLEGELRLPARAGLVPQAVSARARVTGTLAGTDARLRLQADAPQLQASATVRPWRPQPLEHADVHMERFNLAPFWPAAPQTRLTGRLSAEPLSGQTGATWQASATLTNTQPGPWDQQRLPVQRLQLRLQQLPATAQGQPWRLQGLDALVAGGALTGQGEVLLPAAGGPPLQWDGQVRWRGWRPDALLSHLPARPADLDLRAREAQGDTRVELTAQAAQAQLDARGRLDVKAQGFEGEATLTVPGARAQLSGRLAAREGAGLLTLDLAQADRLLAWTRQVAPAGLVSLPDNLRVGGAASTRLRWRGGWMNPAALVLDGQASTSALALETPAGALWLDSSWAISREQGRINASAERLLVQARLAQATPNAPRWPLRNDGPVRLAWGPDGLSTQGRLSGLALAWLDTLPQQPLRAAGLATDLLLDAHWDLTWPRDSRLPPRALIRLERRSGDLRWSADEGHTPLRAEVRALAATLALDGEHLSAQAQWDSERAGSLRASAASRLRRQDGQPVWDADAPLSGQLTARLPQMGVWSVLAPPGWRVAGTLAAEAQVSGTRAAPRFDGQLSASELSVRSDVDGIALGNGRLLARLQGDRIAIENVSLEGSGGAASGGTLVATGSAEWLERAGGREPRLALQVRAERLRASSRADRRLTVSGQVDAALAGARLTLRGDARVDQALFLLPEENTPTLGDDVVVRGQAGPAGARATRVVPDVNVHLDLGPQFEVRGHGLSTRLTGRLNLRSTAERPAPQVLGEVRTASGSYQAYGQRLDIEEGVLRFTGPYDNPALDVLAIRPYTSHRVGVQVRGTARVPQVRLYAQPDLPDSEKLAWLVLGRPASGGGAETAVLQQAALALISGGGGPTLGQRLGLDELSVRGSSGTSTDSGGIGNGAALTLGKRLSERLYVSYERSLAGALGTFAMFYDISRRLTLRARAGEDNALDLVFTLSYD